MTANTAASAGLAACRDPEGSSRQAKNISCRCYGQDQTGGHHPSGDGVDKSSDLTGRRVAVRTAARLLYYEVAPRMSALGQKQTLAQVAAMSALPPTADTGTQPRDVR